MKKISFLFALIFLFSINLFSQVDISTFDKFLGSWVSEYNLATGEQNIETLSNVWILNHAFFEMNIDGSMKDNPDSKFLSKEIFTLDDNDNIVGWGFDESGYRGTMTYKGKIDGNKVVVEGTNPDYKYKHTFELKDGKLTDKREFKRKGKDASIFEVVYSKK